MEVFFSERHEKIFMGVRKEIFCYCNRWHQGRHKDRLTTRIRLSFFVVRCIWVYQCCPELVAYHLNKSQVMFQGEFFHNPKFCHFYNIKADWHPTWLRISPACPTSIRLTMFGKSIALLSPSQQVQRHFNFMSVLDARRLGSMRNCTKSPGIAFMLIMTAK